MNTVIWIIQGALALFFLMPAFMKLTSSKQKLIEKKQIAPDGLVIPVRTIGFLELLGAIGIIVPWLTGIYPILTPLAAMGFAAVMIGAFVVHFNKKEYKTFPLLTIVFILSVIVAVCRF